MANATLPASWSTQAQLITADAAAFDYLGASINELGTTPLAISGVPHRCPGG